MAAGEYVILFSEAESVYRKLTDEQFGILIRAVLAYRLRGERYQGSDIRVDQAFESFSNQVDREAEIRVKRSKAAKKRWEEDGVEDMQEDAMQTDANDAPFQSSPNQSNPVQSNPVQSIPDQSNPDKKRKNNLSEKNKRVCNSADAHTRVQMKSFGQYGWVKLSQQEYDALVDELGQREVDRCITYLDESAQITGNKNRWRDFGLVIRKCSLERWGLDRKQSKDDFKDHYDLSEYGIVL